MSPKICTVASTPVEMPKPTLQINSPGALGIAEYISIIGHALGIGIYILLAHLLE